MNNPDLRYCLCGCGEELPPSRSRNQKEERRFFSAKCRTVHSRNQAERELTESLRTALKRRVRIWKALLEGLEEAPQ